MKNDNIRKKLRRFAALDHEIGESPVTPEHGQGGCADQEQDGGWGCGGADHGQRGAGPRQIGACVNDGDIVVVELTQGLVDTADHGVVVVQQGQGRGDRTVTGDDEHHTHDQASKTIGL